MDSSKRPTVSLGPQSGPDGNVFVVLGQTLTCLRQAGMLEEAEELMDDIFGRDRPLLGYVTVLKIIGGYVVLKWEEERHE